MESMSSVTSVDLPRDYSRRIKAIRGRLQLTQTQFAERVGVSFASVNRWENEQARPTRLAWQRIVELDRDSEPSARGATGPAALAPVKTTGLDFAGNPKAVVAVAEAHRLAYGHLFNPAFASETSLIDPLPHQRIAVYEHMLAHSPLRFLLADDAGAGKTIMAGLYIREMLSRRLIRRILIVPPAGLIGNWERELRTLFRLPFRILTGADARTGNPFLGSDGDRVIVSMDTLAGERMFACLREAATEPYDLVVFDEAHKLSADREPDFRVRKTDRYRLAEAIAGVLADDPRWQLGWSTQHLLLLTATPHMGKDYPYYCLWRLLNPEVLSTYEAFYEFPREARARHFTRRTKEEMVRYDGTPLYPQRLCDTLTYDLTQGPDSEQELYDETTAYIRTYYNRARILNRSAARLAMSVFQRRLASSTYALMRSFERRFEKLGRLIDDIRSGRITETDLQRQQRPLDQIRDLFDETTADEDVDPDELAERHEDFEDQALGGTVALSLAELEAEREQVEALLEQARKLVDKGEESKFEKLREVLRAPDYTNEKFIIFTEHRDTVHFLIRRLEGLGYAGRVAQIHGGMNYLEREEQVAFFRRPAEQTGANYLVATDAAGEGINLQFCWLMVNYDIPWNPARLEQRMGRIHRYGQKHDPVVIVNLVAAKTREGRVLKTLLDKLEAIRRQLQSDKVFDVVGRLFEGVSITQYLELALTDEGTDKAERAILGKLTEEQVRALEERERRLYGDGGDVRPVLARLNEDMEHEQLRRLLPGYVRRFVERAAPLLDLVVEGDPDNGFALAPARPRALDPLHPALELYPEATTRSRLTVHKPSGEEEAIWLHPGEPVFDMLAEMVVDRFAPDASRGGIFVDPTAEAPYLFHLALVTVVRRSATTPSKTPSLFAPGTRAESPELLEARLVGVRQSPDGGTEGCPVEHLLLLRGARGVAPGSVPLAALARELCERADTYLGDDVVRRLVAQHRQHLLDELPERVAFVSRGFDYQTAELAAARARLADKARAGDAHAKAELTRIKEHQRRVTAERDARLAAIKAEPELVDVGEVKFLAHALVVPSTDSEERKRYDAEVEAIAVKVAMAYEESLGAAVLDVSRPELARRAGLPDWPGFDLLSQRPGEGKRPIEVKGRAGVGEVELSENEWAKACNLRDRYWLYVVFDCATPRPRLLRVRDPFRNLLVKAKGGVVIPSVDVLSAAEPEAV